MQDCIFCKIVAKALPSCRVYEDDLTIAFLDIGPIVKGHTLVVPRQHIDPLTAAPPAILTACLQTVQRVMQAHMQALGADGVNLHQANGAAAGQVVPHLHFHVIPRFTNDGHHWNWHAKSYTEKNAMEEMANRIARGIPGEMPA